MGTLNPRREFMIGNLLSTLKDLADLISPRMNWGLCGLCGWDIESNLWGLPAQTLVDNGRQ